MNRESVSAVKMIRRSNGVMPSLVDMSSLNKEDREKIESVYGSPTDISTARAQYATQEPRRDWREHLETIKASREGRPGYQDQLSEYPFAGVFAPVSFQTSDREREIALRLRKAYGRKRRHTRLLRFLKSMGSSRYVRWLNMQKRFLAKR